MGDTPTDVTGAVIRRVRGADYVVVNLRHMYSGPPPTILGLSTDLQISADAILSSVLSNGANAHVIAGLYASHVRGPFPGLRKARAALSVAAHTYTATGSGRMIHVTETPYLEWGVDTDKPIVLPMSRGFRNLMVTTTERRQREARIRSVSPSFEALKRQQRALQLAVVRLNNTIELYDRFIAGNLETVATLEALNGLFEFMFNRPKSPPSKDDQAELRALQRRFDRLRAQAYNDMIFSPPDSQVSGMFSLRESQSREVLDKLRDSHFVENVRVLTDNTDVAPAAMLHDLCETITYAYRTLMVTPRADEAAHDIRAALDMLASKVFDTSGLTSSPNSAFNADILKAVAMPPADTALVMIVKLLTSAGPNAVGNLPGPASVAVAVVEMAGLLMLPKVMRDPVNAGSMAARLFRALVVSAGMDGKAGMAQRVRLFEAVQSGDVSAMRRIPWASRFMTSAAWCRGMAASSLISFFFAVTTDDSSTLRRWANIVGSGATTGLGVALSFGRYGGLISRGILKLPLANTAANALGVVGGLAAVVSGTVTAVEEFGAGDNSGAWIAGAGAAGGAMSVAGFLVAAGAATSATVVGAPAGTVLMAVGAVLMVGSGVIAAVRGFLTAGSQVVWVDVLKHLNRPGGPLQRTMAERPALRAAFDDVFGQRESAAFWEVSSKNANDLKDLGFSVEQIAFIVDETKAIVEAQLATEARP